MSGAWHRTWLESPYLRKRCVAPKPHHSRRRLIRHASVTESVRRGTCPVPGTGRVLNGRRLPRPASAEPEERSCVVLQDQGLHLVPEPGLLEVPEPALRGDERVVAPEEHIAAELRVRVLHELRREVLRRPH